MSRALTAVFRTKRSHFEFAHVCFWPCARSTCAASPLQDGSPPLSVYQRAVHCVCLHHHGNCTPFALEQVLLVRVESFKEKYLAGQGNTATVGMKPAACCLVACAAVAAATSPTAYTKNGYVQGFPQDGVNVYNRIPFAQPPVGDLRFKAPKSAVAWNGTKDVSELPPICPQLKLDGVVALSEDEDCLYLVC